MKIAWLFLVMMLAACTSDTERDLKELKHLCEKDAGLTIYKSVKADGYYDSTRKGEALHLLIPSDYGFIEFCNFDSKKPSFNEPGCWRLTKTARGTGQCNEIVDKTLRTSGRALYKKYREQNCISVEKIAEPTAKYRYEVERKEWWLNESAGTKMSWGVGRIVNNKTGEILGKGINYILRPKRSNPPSFHCGSARITGLQKSMPFAAGLIEKTLIPSTNQITGVAK